MHIFGKQVIRKGEREGERDWKNYLVNLLASSRCLINRSSKTVDKTNSYANKFNYNKVVSKKSL